MKKRKGSVIASGLVFIGILATFGKTIEDKSHEFLSNGLNDSHRKTIVFYSNATEEQKADLDRLDPYSSKFK